MKPKIVQDRDRRKDDLVSGIKILAHNLVILIGILVGWKGIDKRRTRKILDYVIRRQGYIEEFGTVIVIRIITPYKKRIRDDISDFIKINAGDVILKSGAFVTVFVRKKVAIIELLDKVCRQ